MQEAQPQKLDLFPKIFRFITEQAELLVISFVSGFVIIGIVLQSVRLSENMQKITVIEAERLQLSKELSYWQDVSRQYIGYRDVYLKIAGLQYQLGDLSQAKTSVDKALSLDPNFRDGQVLGASIAR